MITPKAYEDRLRKMQPLIIIGMHRSGTSLIVRLLEEMGIHLGIHLSRDAESIFFQKINRRIYKSAGSTWGDIDLLLASMKDENFIREEREKVLKTLISDKSLLGFNKGVANHFGPENWSTLVQDDDIWWGWKDPRTTLTFPIWLKVFPNARVLHILRNGIDVAISTHRRSQKQKGIFWKQIIPLDFCPQTLDFEYCYGLWEKYVSFALSNKDMISSDQYMEVKFEDLLSQPIVIMKAIASFIEYPIKDEIVKNACQQIDRGRRDNSNYRKLYQEEIQQLTNYQLMNRLGYQLPLQTDFGEVNFEK